ncbi:MAG: hypothetical protein PHD95_00740 [Candidatus ainarchaeum sp.]|nr:hypothetical protein [Candidatus ainarchaeum sp.]
MDVTTKCIISGKHGFELTNTNRFAIIEVEAKNGDLIKVNKVNGIRYNEIWSAVENPRTEEHPIIDDHNKIIVIGGENKQSKRTIVIVGK